MPSDRIVPKQELEREGTFNLIGKTFLGGVFPTAGLKDNVSTLAAEV